MQTTISYSYDALYRLTDAVYSNGFEFHYTYDPVGNRLTQTTCAPSVPCSTTTYEYDAANRLTAVNGVAYAWDGNGNLLNDGKSTYAYDSENRLKTLTQAGHTYAFGYSGQGDRLTQAVDSVVTRYTLDLNAGLTQVLSDGSYAYLYGNERIAQVSAGETDYFLGDALGSVRQLADASGAVTLAKSYEPYGTVMESAGNGVTAYGFDGEQQQSGLTYLRARYLDNQQGRLLTRDLWAGSVQVPMSFNGWLYAYSSPTIYNDPTGKDAGCANQHSALYCAALAGYLVFNANGIPEVPDPSWPVTIGTQPGCTYESYVACFYVRRLFNIDGQMKVDPDEFSLLTTAVYIDIKNRTRTPIDRTRYDTPFWDASGSAPGRVCFENDCYERHEVNYFAQGMWSAAEGEPMWFGEVVIVGGWKACNYLLAPKIYTSCQRQLDLTHCLIRESYR